MEEHYVCPACDGPSRASDRFCAYCGAEFEPEPTLDQLHAFALTEIRRGCVNRDHFIQSVHDAQGNNLYCHYHSNAEARRDF